LAVDDVLTVLGGLQAVLRHLLADAADAQGARCAPTAGTLTVRAIRLDTAAALLHLRVDDSGGVPVAAEALARLFATAPADPLVTRYLDGIARRLGPGIESVGIEGEGPGQQLTIACSEPGTTTGTAVVRESGRLALLNAHTCTAELHNPAADVRIVFDRALLPEMRRHAGDFIEVIGHIVGVAGEEGTRLYATTIEQAWADGWSATPTLADPPAEGLGPYKSAPARHLEPGDIDELMEAIERDREWERAGSA
jgi:hypothetical protein